MSLHYTWPPLTSIHRSELKYLLGLLRTIMPYDRAILYGRYAGSRMRSEIGGYELLLVTRSMPTVEGWQIDPMLDI